MSAPGTAGAAPTHRRVLAQARFELAAVLRNGEQLMVTVALPLVALIVLTSATAIELSTAGLPRVDVVAPGVLAFAVLSAAFTSPAIATAFDRRNGVLRLLATTPLGRSGLLAGKVAAVLGVQLLSGTLLVLTGAAMGWRPSAAGLVMAAAVGVLGTAAFVALALLVAGTLRAEAVLAVANLVLIALALGGGVLVPVDDLPGPLAALAPWLPSGALGEALRAALTTGTVPAGPIVVLVVWAAALSAAVARFFRWD
ncbi:MAG: ABC transporter permease [Actinobacteria bacterium]|nr:ABC transporter permease [Actinomycetota bacterium]